MKTGRKVMAAAGILLMAASVVAAQDEWNFELSPYLWTAGIEGDVEVNGRKADVDMGFDDMLDAMEIGGGLETVVRRDCFVMWGQFDYMAMNTDEVDSGPTRGSLELDTFMGALAVGRQFDGPFDGSTIDVMGGVLYTGFDSHLEITGLAKRHDSQDIVDGIFVVRSSLRLSEKWRLISTCAIGGGDSDVVWGLQPILRCRVSDNMALNLGYRRLHYDVKGQRNNRFDADFHGLILGATFGY